MKKVSKLLLVLLLLLTLAACNKIEIYTGLTEPQANEMLAVLIKQGIGADKKSLGKNGYSISVSANEMSLAFEILKDNSLPKENFQNLGTVFSGQGMISSTNEEKSRLAYAISQELSDTYSRFDGVLETRVHIVLG